MKDRAKVLSSYINGKAYYVVVFTYTVDDIDIDGVIVVKAKDEAGALRKLKKHYLNECDQFGDFDTVGFTIYNLKDREYS